MAYVTANARPEVDVTSRSSSYQTSRGMLRQSSNGDEEEYLDAEEDETVSRAGVWGEGVRLTGRS